MNTHTNHREAKKRRRKLLRSWGTDEGILCLEHFEKHFETHLPAFQGEKGQFDPLDAMRRDAYREVFLHIRHQLELAHQEQSAEGEPMDIPPEQLLP